jgi:hypothetical protein
MNQDILGRRRRVKSEARRPWSRGPVCDHPMDELHPLKAALEDRIAALGRSGSWPEIISDLDSLTGTEIEHEGKHFVRSAPRPAATLALRAAGVALPPTVRNAAASSPSTSPKM